MIERALSQMGVSMRRVAQDWFAIGLLVVLCVYSSPIRAEAGAENPREEAVASLLDADRAWARTTDAEGFTSFLADDAIYALFHWRVMEGKKEWGPWANDIFARADFVLDWEAVRVGLGPSADMGYTAGDWRCTWKDPEGNPKELVGPYLAVWERRDDGDWKVVAHVEYSGERIFELRDARPE
jgi:ketosteroid isomerase-like protein